MLKKYPTLRFILHRCGWYFLTFIVAVTINFFLPRFGADPIALVMSKMKGSNAKVIHQKRVAFMKEFGLVETAEVTATNDGHLLLDSEGKAIAFNTLKQSGALKRNDLATFWSSPVKIDDPVAFRKSIISVADKKSGVLGEFAKEFAKDSTALSNFETEELMVQLRNTLTLDEVTSLKGVTFAKGYEVYDVDYAALKKAVGKDVFSVSPDGDIPFVVAANNGTAVYTYTSKTDLTPKPYDAKTSLTEAEDGEKAVTTFKIAASTEVLNQVTISQKSGNKEFSPVKRPLIKQYFSYLAMVLKGDLGTSFNKYPKKVNTIVAEALPWTLAIQFPSIVLGWLVGNILGALAAYKRGVFDKIFFPLAMLSNSIPFFAVGMILVWVFAEMIPIFPASGGYGIDVVPGFTWAFISGAAYYYILPFFSVFPVMASGQATGMRSMGIYELGTGYVKYAKTLGVKENKILFYIFRNAMLPQLAGLAIQLGVMIGGALITELIFSYPGLGMALLTAAQNNDYPLIQGAALLVTITVLLANFTVDILIGFFDPRVKAGRTGA